MEKVVIEGIAKEDGLNYAGFKLNLDRSGHEPEEIMESVKLYKEELDDLDNVERIVNYNEGVFNTSFEYELLDDKG